MLAGDYTDTGLPATIEGAIASGFAAARLARAPGVADGFRVNRRGRKFPAATNSKNLAERQPNFR